MTYTFSNSREQVQAMIAENPQSALALEQAKQHFRRWESCFDDQVDWISGWAHNFTCPVCAAQLPFSLEQTESFQCPHCGAVCASQDHSEAWVYYYRYEAAQDLSAAAVLSLLGDESAQNYILRFVDFYADHYGEFLPHGHWVGKGKIMAQELDEAVWALAVLRALQSSGIVLSPEKRQSWCDNLFRPMADFLLEQLQPRIHNIELWMLSSIGAIAVWSNDQDLLDHVLNKPYGIRQQVQDGYTADGFWYEGSTHYHFYTTESLTEFLCWYALIRPEDPLFGVQEKCYRTPMRLSSDGWEIPSTNDGWYPLDVSTYFRQIQRAARVADSPVLQSQLSMTALRRPECFHTPESLLFGAGIIQFSNHIPQGNTFLRQTNFAVIREPFHAVLRSGVLDESHMHADYASISLDRFSRDLGTPGYGNQLTGDYYRTTFSHNSFTVNGESQPNQVIPSWVEEIRGGFRAVIDCMSNDPDSCYYGVSCIRSLTAEDGWLLDRMDLVAPREVTFDWLLHADGIPELPESAGKAVLSFPFFTHAQIYAPGSFRASFRLDGRTLTVKTDDDSTQRVFTARTPGNPANHHLTLLLLRKRGMSVRFEVRYRID